MKGIHPGVYRGKLFPNLHRVACMQRRLQFGNPRGLTGKFPRTRTIGNEILTSSTSSIQVVFERQQSYESSSVRLAIVEFAPDGRYFLIDRGIRILDLRLGRLQSAFRRRKLIGNC